MTRKYREPFLFLVVNFYCQYANRVCDCVMCSYVDNMQTISNEEKKKSPTTYLSIFRNVIICEPLWIRRGGWNRTASTIRQEKTWKTMNVNGMLQRRLRTGVQSWPAVLFVIRIPSTLFPPRPPQRNISISQFEFVMNRLPPTIILPCCFCFQMLLLAALCSIAALNICY